MEFGLQRSPVILRLDRGPDRLDLVDQHLLRLDGGEHRRLQPLGPVGVMFEQGEAEGVEGLALVQFPARPLQRPRRGGEAAEPVEEERLPAQPLAAFTRHRQGRVQQPLVRRLAEALHPQPLQKRGPQFADIGRTETVQRLG